MHSCRRATRICTHTAERPARTQLVNARRLAYWPTRPSMRSRNRSAWPLWRAYSSIMWTMSSQRDRLPGTVPPDEAEIGVTSELLGEGDLVVPCSPGILDNRLIGHGAVEVTIGLDVGLVASGYVLAREPLPEPLPLDIGHVAHQT